MSQSRLDPIAASPQISSIVRSAVIVATIGFFCGALMNAILGQRDIAVILALAAPLGISAWGFVRSGHHEAALALLCCVLITVITLILVLNPLGVHDMAITAYAGVVSFAAMLFSRRAFFLVVGLTVFAATAAFAYDLGGYSRSVVAQHSGWPQFLDFLLIVGAFAFLSRTVGEKLHATLGDAHFAAGTDPLTGLVNRARFVVEASERLRAAKANGESGALVLADLDGFRRMNLVVGREAADGVLQECANRLMGECGGDLVARIGDDQFAVLRLGMHDSHTAQFARVVHTALDFDVRGMSVRNSAGYARFPRDGSDIDSLMMTAESGIAHSQELETDKVSGPADRI
jgi:diguanylate cyclase (GGDEF)-like protein